MGGQSKRCSHSRVPKVPQQTATVQLSNSETPAMTKVGELQQALLRRTALKALLQMEQEKIAHLRQQMSKE